MVLTDKVFATVKKLEFLFIFIAGAAGALIFPPYVGSWQGYVGLIAFLTLLLTSPTSKKRLFFRGYVFGFAFYVTGFIWINNALLIDENKFVAFVPFVFMAIGLFFGLFWALPVLSMAWGRNIYAKALIFCGSFVLFEWIRSFIFTGFPWNLLGTALSFEPKLLQGAAYAGVYGLSLCLLFLLCGAAILLAGLIERKFYWWGIFFLLFPAVFLYGASIKYKQYESGHIVVRLVQPSIPQTFKWDAMLAYENFRKYIDLSTSQPLSGVDMVVWGETASPYYLDMDPVHLQEITEAVPESGFLITGLLRIGIEAGQYVPYNSLFVINKEGVIKDYYDKAHLVPFGEYLPFREYLPEFMTPVASVVGNLGKGEALKSISVDGLPLMGGAICYESIFPAEVVNAERKPELLLVLANDGWYGVSAGPAQHLAAAQLRAVEEGITVIRSANTGISAVVTSYGEILGRIELNEKGILDIRLPKELSHATVYGKYGNAIPLILLGLTLLLGLFLNIIIRFKNRTFG